MFVWKKGDQSNREKIGRRTYETNIAFDLTHFPFIDNTDDKNVPKYDHKTWFKCWGKYPFCLKSIYLTERTNTCESTILGYLCLYIQGGAH